MRASRVAGALAVAMLAMAGVSACHSGGGNASGGSASPNASAAAPSGSASGSSSSSGANGSASAAAGAFPNTSLDPCALLTQSQVAAAVGMAVDKGVTDNGTPGSRGCKWNTSAGDAGAGPDQIAVINLEVMGPNPALKSRYPTADAFYASLKQLYASDLQPVSGVGDDAFVTQKQHWIFAKKGTVVLRVFATFGQPATDATVITKLMTEAMAGV